MAYDEYHRAFPDDSLLDGLTVSSSSSNIVILPPNKKTEWGNLMPTLLDFWSAAVQDDSVAGFLYLSGSCLPLKPFSYVHRTIMNFHPDLSILNFANVFRSKASMWGYHSRRAAVEIQRNWATQQVVSTGIRLHQKNVAQPLWCRNWACLHIMGLQPLIAGPEKNCSTSPCMANSWNFKILHPVSSSLLTLRWWIAFSRVAPSLLGSLRKPP